MGDITINDFSMRQITDINELHGILLDIGKEFHRICSENSIPYYMLGGTMLGAVRHKGFIPWDDDMDFGVPREYFEKLKDALRTNLDKKYELQTLDNSDALILDMIKIKDNRTKLVEIFKEDVECNGINVDIFPLDKATDKVGHFKLIGKIIRLQEYRFLSVYPLSPMKKGIAYLIKALFFWLKKRTSMNFINNHFVERTGDFVTNIYGAWREKETVPENVMGSPKLYVFENTHFFGVADSDAYLKSLYNNYMQLPPENKRHIHLVGAYWK